MEYTQLEEPSVQHAAIATAREDSSFPLLRHPVERQIRPVVIAQRQMFAVPFRKPRSQASAISTDRSWELECRGNISRH